MKNSIINRQFKYTNFNASIILVMINIFVFILTSNYPKLLTVLALNPLKVHYGHCYWQFFTYMFVHGSFSHLFNNMFSILIFSLLIEKAIGSKEYLLFYLLVGTLSGVASYFTFMLTGNYFTFLLGASGALYGILLLFAVLFPTSRILVFWILPVRAPILVAIYFIVELTLSVAGSSDGIAHLTHLFGLVFAYLYIRVRLRFKPLQRWGIL